MATHVNYKSLPHISWPSSRKQQRGMIKLGVVWGTQTGAVNFSYLHLELNAVM